MGRWQTRIAMLATIGLLVTLIFALLFRGPFSPIVEPVFFFVLGYVALFGLAWDLLWMALQSFRWDRDWPPAFQVLTGLIEGVVLYLLIAFVGLPGIPRGSIDVLTFVLHYGLIWWLVFLWVQGPMRAFFPFWRFHGGQITPTVPNAPRS